MDLRDKGIVEEIKMNDTTRKDTIREVFTGHIFCSNYEQEGCYCIVRINCI